MKSFFSAALAAAFLFACSFANATQFNVRIVNLTNGIWYTPFLVVAHPDGSSLFSVGQPVAIVIGTPGGSTIFTSVFQTIVNILDFGMTPGEAVGATRFHHQLLPPDLVTYSPLRPLPQETISALGDRGYRAEPHFFAFGDVQVILRNGDDIQAVSDPRRRGEARLLQH